MSDEEPFFTTPDRLSELTDALERSATRLREEDLDADDAAALVDDCARLAAEAATELDRALRRAAGTGDEPLSGQGGLL